MCRCNPFDQVRHHIEFIVWGSMALGCVLWIVQQPSLAQSPPSTTSPVIQSAATQQPPNQPRLVQPLAEAALTFDGLRFAGFSPDGKTVRVGSTKGQFQRLAATDLALVGKSEAVPPFGVASSAVTPDHRLVAVGGWRGDILVFNSQSDEIIAQLPVQFDLDQTAVTAIAITKDASKCVVGNRSSIVRMYQTVPPELLWESEPLSQAISGVTISKDGKHVAVSTGDAKDFKIPGKIVAFDAATGKVRHKWLDTTAKVNHVAIAGDSRTLLAADNSALRVYDLISGRLLHANPGFAGVQRLMFIDDRRCVVSLYPNRLAIWDIFSKQTVALYAGHKRGADASVSQLIWSLDIAPNGKTLVTADTLGQVYLWPIPAN